MVMKITIQVHGYSLRHMTNTRRRVLVEVYRIYLEKILFFAFFQTVWV